MGESSCGVALRFDIGGVPRGRLRFAVCPSAELTAMLHVLAEPAATPSICPTSWPWAPTCCRSYCAERTRPSRTRAVKEQVVTGEQPPTQPVAPHEELWLPSQRAGGPPVQLTAC
ncbi:DUF5937 family protein [Streptomyces sp. NPDC059442]|uniref:DUF5937 family protein n=1 Tax=Streptomyces sp. NPDC059442 TaxID=3346830 RepID=UPI0036A4E0AC